jgi:hypothetical protein
MRRLAPIAVVLAVLAASSFPLSANSADSHRFTFRRPPAPESAIDQVDKSGRMFLDITRWSSDAERDRIVAAIAADGVEKVLSALNTPNLGTLRWPGGTDYGVRYARQLKRADGGTDVILLVDRPLWLWWQSKPPSTTYPFTLIQMRLAANGSGEGRVSLDVPVTADTNAGLVLADYAQAPAVLADVRREPMGK